MTHAPSPLQWNDLTLWVERNFTGIAIVAGIWLWITLVLIARLWHHSGHLPPGRKIFWTAVLGIPFLGWLLYGGLFRIYPVTDMPAPESAGMNLDKSDSE